MILSRKRLIPRFFVLDLDGVFTNGKFLYSKEGKEFKLFGPDDHDALKAIAGLLEIHVVTADVKGFEISKRRIVDDMDFPLSLVSAKDRPVWIESNFDLLRTIYMGDGFFDHKVFEKVSYGIAPSDALERTKKFANYVTSRGGGERAVTEACIHIAKKFFDVSL
jgi:3-deoxy-D-manno-octulosonate 8-phosphate phosphatase (KDO 8-P phosphatase)